MQADSDQPKLEIDTQQVKARLDSGESFLLLDCREQAEYEPELGQNVEMTQMQKTYNMDEVLPSEAQLDFGALDEIPELGELKPFQGYSELDLAEPEMETEELMELRVVQLGEDAIIDAEAAEDYIVLARQVALVAAEAAEEITEVTVMGVSVLWPAAF